MREKNDTEFLCLVEIARNNLLKYFLLVFEYIFNGFSRLCFNSLMDKSTNIKKVKNSSTQNSLFYALRGERYVFYLFYFPLSPLPLYVLLGQSLQWKEVSVVY